jgi:hypothetical protein
MIQQIHQRHLNEMVDTSVVVTGSPLLARLLRTCSSHFNRNNRNVQLPAINKARESNNTKAMTKQ